MARISIVARQEGQDFGRENTSESKEMRRIRILPQGNRRAGAKWCSIPSAGPLSRSKSTNSPGSGGTWRGWCEGSKGDRSFLQRTDGLEKDPLLNRSILPSSVVLTRTYLHSYLASVEEVPVGPVSVSDKQWRWVSVDG
ncbi:hypothetical protein B296_00025010 [Ensete ventricosum]|uniref:Uncharacterized protein n=1 Tax=Ensete ventricosum TaxID=4639 RepID=A0A427ATT6_ENSVE|nr:hypothetical protein B296_00025010 [Ensete ventricosum]